MPGPAFEVHLRDGAAAVVVASALAEGTVCQEFIPSSMVAGVISPGWRVRDLHFTYIWSDGSCASATEDQLGELLDRVGRSEFELELVPGAYFEDLDDASLREAGLGVDVDALRAAGAVWGSGTATVAGLIAFGPWSFFERHPGSGFMRRDTPSRRRSARRARSPPTARPHGQPHPRPCPLARSLVAARW